MTLLWIDYLTDAQYLDDEAIMLKPHGQTTGPSNSSRGDFSVHPRPLPP